MKKKTGKVRHKTGSSCDDPGGVTPAPRGKESLAGRIAALGTARSEGLTRGDTAVRVAWDSGQITVGDTVKRVVILDGTYAALWALTPERGAEYEEWDGFVVDTAVLAPRRGGLGRLTINLTTYNWFNSILAETALRETWEIDMAQIERPLLTHPKLTQPGDNYKGVHLGRWWNAPDRDDVFFTYADGAGEATLTEDEQTWAMKMLSGVESYLQFAPVVTRTAVYDGRPAATKAGFIETPGTKVDGFEYLKTGDRVTQNEDKTWTRVQQWTGADKWDADIYAEE